MLHLQAIGFILLFLRQSAQQFVSLTRASMAESESHIVSIASPKVSDPLGRLNSQGTARNGWFMRRVAGSNHIGGFV